MEYAGRIVVRMGAARKRAALKSSGLRRRAIHLQEGATTIFCWVPKELEEAIASSSSKKEKKKTQKEQQEKPALLLLHGFGSNGTDAWAGHVGALAKHFALFIPDLLFFGDSITRSPTRCSELFQAECIHAALLQLGVTTAFVAGHSYGGFVAYRLAHLFPSFVSKLVIIASGLMMDSHSNDAALQKTGASSIHDILVPSSLSTFKQTLQLVFNKPTTIPDFVLMALLKNPNRDHQLDLINSIELGQDEVPTTLPKVSQKTLILWGDKDQIFDIKLAHTLEEYMDGNAQLKVFNGAGHVPQVALGFNDEIISFLTKDMLDASSTPNVLGDV
ncbi:hypothetical protein GOP47_0017707 [Adiantum capillus-veneris]|uniref:AB hydrolase-1 domain-containing protein n=1 Tax=Adiantum capillus-veneris TaxID=13818 RepID=A0A9D4Z9Y1_ADICA|nr:hypothetical protein GOP47_0017707 [Adiantum capillus-veneris]